MVGGGGGRCSREMERVKEIEEVGEREGGAEGRWGGGAGQ